MNAKRKRVMPLLAGAVIQLCIGIIYIWSVFKQPLTDYYGAHAAADLVQSSLTASYSIMLCTFVLGIVLGGRLNDRRGPHIVVVLGGCLFAAGILLSAASASLWPAWPQLICLFYGGMAGFGVGAAYTSTISCVQKWFLDKKGFATGVIVCAFGASTVLFTPVVNQLLLTVGVTKTFVILGILFFAVVMALARFIQNPDQDYLQAFAGSQPTARQKQYKPSEIIKTNQYWLLLFCMMLLTAAYFIFNPIFMPLGISRGLSENTTLVAVMMTGVASAAGRLAAPWLSDVIGRRWALLLLYLITIASVLLLLVTTGPIYLLLISLIAFAFGGSAGIFPAINADYFGTQHAGINYGLIMIGFAVSALLFPSIATFVNKGGATTPLTYVLPAVASVGGIILSLMLKKPESKDEMI